MHISILTTEIIIDQDLHQWGKTIIGGGCPPPLHSPLKNPVGAQMTSLHYVQVYSIKGLS